MKPVKVGICGLGTVGGGTFNVLTRNTDSITARTGRQVIIEQVATRRGNPACDTSQTPVTTDIFDVAQNPDIDILVELIGGYDVAKDLILTAINNGKHVVTANKALIAEHGNEIFKAARENNVIVAYEAAVAGGIPVIKTLREGLAANDINWLAGIINGTGNFILTEMGDKNRPFEDVLQEAQELGYAEADPTFDVEGIDACHKLTIMASIAFGIPLQFNKAFTEGISQVTPGDIQYAEDFGYRIKHLGISRKTEQGIELRVHPALIPADRPMANINGVLNSVVINADAIGETMLVGPGAGSEPTASSVVADIIDIARNLETPASMPFPLGFHSDSMQPTEVLSVDDVECPYYLRIHVDDHPGVIRALSSVLDEYNINISALTQKAAREHDRHADVVILTETVKEAVMKQAVKKIEALEEVQSRVALIRVEAMA
ncbi:homoserine dehydrogenase [Endozoicomonas montiporae]|uniref:Homoserine dehydrogenase n=2 Tax=Endozoicomonas montiporae TaxID=1027273 RepID=A0A081NBG6_9GAMM|nr:homoserine dehydrogenase [Endozoicomonas montiporae]AMO56073.1 homoserine dehydrogenase [Endozoicomonas montiporae CL-33]KEQ15789.1 homoserine dehydrogenase [Endozoicomonas montiporae]